MNIYFQPDFTDIVIAIGSINLLAAIFLATFYARRILSVPRHSRRTPRLDGDAPVRCPSISVVVYDCDNAESLGSMLPQLLAQNYPVPFEVIVAIDGRSEAADDVVSRLCVDHGNLRVTFVPDEAHALSRKKLALTLGIKAARHEYVLLTDAAAVIPSYDWLLSLGRHFAGGKEVVIGHSHPVGKDGSHERPMTAFDTLRDSVTYLSSAIGRRPYRASSANFAFSRHLFFDNKGFASSVGYHRGEDDIFVSMIATSRNTAVELSPQSRVALQCNDVRSAHRFEKLRHMFTGKYVSKRSRRFFAAGSIAAWAWLMSAAALGLLTWPNIFPLTVAAGVGLTWMTVTTVAWKSAARTLDIDLGAAAVVPAMFLHPFVTAVYIIRSKTYTQHNYTWSKP